MSIVDDLQDKLLQMISKEMNVNIIDNIKTLELNDPLLDKLIFGQGFPIGCLLMITGHPGSFKSTFASNIVAFLQKYHNAIIIYFDNENSCNPTRLKSMGLENIKPISGLTLEKINGIVYSLAKYKETNKEHKDRPIIIIWDSLAATPCEAELNTLDVNKTEGLNKARILSSYLVKWVNEILPVYNISIIIINQLREKINLSFIPQSVQLKNLSYDKILPGGNSVLFLSNMIIEQKTITNYDTDQSPYGFKSTIVEIKTVKNKYFPDGIKLPLVFSPVWGYDPQYTWFEFLKRVKVIKSKGPKQEIDGLFFRAKELKQKLSEDNEFSKRFFEILNLEIERVRNRYLNEGSSLTDSNDDISEIEN